MKRLRGLRRLAPIRVLCVPRETHKLRSRLSVVSRGTNLPIRAPLHNPLHQHARRSTALPPDRSTSRSESAARSDSGTPDSRMAVKQQADPNAEPEQVADAELEPRLRHRIRRRVASRVSADRALPSMPSDFAKRLARLVPPDTPAAPGPAKLPKDRLLVPDQSRAPKGPDSTSVAEQSRTCSHERQHRDKANEPAIKRAEPNNAPAQFERPYKRVHQRQVTRMTTPVQIMPTTPPTCRHRTTSATTISPNSRGSWTTAQAAESRSPKRSDTHRRPT